MTKTDAEKAGFLRFESVEKHIPSSDKLYRSSAPNYDKKDGDSSQSLTDDSIKFLQDKGIVHIISLNSKASSETISKKLKDNSIDYTPLPVTDFTAPTLDQLKTGNSNWSTDAHRKGTLVWCGYGHGRTGTMVTGIQVYEEKAKKDKKQSWKKISHTEYSKNHVEKKHEKKSTGQYEVLDALQKQEGLEEDKDEGKDKKKAVGEYKRWDDDDDERSDDDDDENMDKGGEEYEKC